MSAQVLYAKPYVEKEKQALVLKVEQGLTAFGRPPGLALILVGNDPASQVYTGRKREMAKSLGFKSEIFTYPEDVDQLEVQKKIEALNQDSQFDGIILQRPLPDSFDKIAPWYWIDPSKDVDGLHPIQLGKLELQDHPLIPCTALGVMKLLDFYGLTVNSKLCAVIGKSRLVGKPLASLLLNAGATILQCHSDTQDLASLTRQADFLFSATGQVGLIGKEHVRPRAVVVDIGIKKATNGVLVGDTKYSELLSIARGITPVPGGVGPMTVITLMSNTVRAYYASNI
jgi:methylenetetrahydrofolate dehydrogenase (NADP+)/methenyltetrahydrofolate cyclohydrolase